MGDIEEEIHDGKETEIEGVDPRNVYQKYEGTVFSLLEADDLEKKVKKGGYVHDLPDTAGAEAKYSTGKKKWVDGKLKVYGEDKDLVGSLEDENPNNTAALYPWVQKGIHRRQKELKEIKDKESLESIIAHTPEDRLEALFKYITPIESLGGEYGDIARLHSEFSGMERLWKAYNGEEGEKGKPGERPGDFDKKQALEKIKGVIENHYKHNTNYVKEEGTREVNKIDEFGNPYTKSERVLKIKEDKKEVLDAIIQTIKYSETFALRKMARLLGKKQEEFSKAIKDKVPDYVRATLMKLKDVPENKKKRMPDGNTMVYGIYEKFYQDQYKAKNKQDEE